MTEHDLDRLEQAVEDEKRGSYAQAMRATTLILARAPKLIELARQALRHIEGTVEPVGGGVEPGAEKIRYFRHLVASGGDEPDQIGALHQVLSNDTSEPLTIDSEDADGGGLDVRPVRRG